MRWLLMVFVFTLTESGDVQRPVILYKSYGSENECNLVGENFRSVIPIPEGAKSLSTCVPESAYDAGDWQIID